MMYTAHYVVGIDVIHHSAIDVVSMVERKVRAKLMEETGRWPRAVCWYAHVPHPWINDAIELVPWRPEWKIPYQARVLICKGYEGS